MHNVDLILTLTLGFSAALVLGYVTQRLGLSPILGYLLAGIAAGPYTPGPVADARLAAQLAEVGVILLMFGVGLHFHLKDLLAVRAIAIPGAVGQSLVATAFGALIAWGAGWPLGSGIVLGIAISVASTVVLMRVLVDNKALDTPQGHIAVGWLIVEDILTVLVLVLLPVVASSAGQGGGAAAIAGSLGLALLKIGVLVFLVLVLGSRVIPWILTQVARTRSRELFTLAVLALALVVATGSAVLFGASMALGAFLAGMVVGQSKVSEQAAADALPMRDAFAVLFFVSVGMLFDPRFLAREPLLVLAVLGVILIAKPLIALAIVLSLGYTVRTALTVALGLAQIGEFSFILADQAKGILPPAAGSLLVAGALLSIALNPLLFRVIGPLESRLRKRKKLWSRLNRRAENRVKNVAVHLPADEAAVRAVVVGYGPVGRTTRQILESFGIRPVVVDLNVDTVNRLKAEGVPAVYGDAAKSDILQAAGTEKAKYLVVTLPDLVARLPVLISARELNPDIQIFSRARYLAERGTLEEFGVTAVCYEEAEAASGLAEFLLRAEGAPEERIERELDRIAAELAVPRRRPSLFAGTGDLPPPELP
jgi:monovalent cation:H+ antiporter-2, CPA2 family